MGVLCLCIGLLCKSLCRAVKYVDDIVPFSTQHREARNI